MSGLTTSAQASVPRKPSYTVNNSNTRFYS
jgi:hypothetical protein